MFKILLVEDDENLATSLLELLALEGFMIDLASDATKALDLSFIREYDLFLFDVNIPNMSGFDLLKSFRDMHIDTPAIFITALRDIASLSQGFSVGADDYIKKPFDFDELLVRIHALLKRGIALQKQKIVYGNFTFDIKKNELYKDEKFIPLSPYELAVVELFFKNIDKTLSKESILSLVGGSDGSLRVCISSLRKLSLKIETLKSIGYRLGKV